jgi:hypothetical protein
MKLRLSARNHTLFEGPLGGQAPLARLSVVPPAIAVGWQQRSFSAQRKSSPICTERSQKRWVNSADLNRKLWAWS